MKFEFEVTEINYILEVLSQRPYKEVTELVDKIKEQGQTQVENKE